MPAAPASILQTSFARFLLLCFFQPFVGLFQCVVRVLFEGKQEFRKRLPDRRINEHHNNDPDQDTGKVEQRAEPFPAAPLGIIENWLRHGPKTKNILAAG